jgi:hypothetical protein
MAPRPPMPRDADRALQQLEALAVTGHRRSPADSRPAKRGKRRQRRCVPLNCHLPRPRFRSGRTRPRRQSASTSRMARSSSHKSGRQGPRWSETIGSTSSYSPPSICLYVTGERGGGSTESGQLWGRLAPPATQRSQDLRIRERAGRQDDLRPENGASGGYLRKTATVTCRAQHPAAGWAIRVSSTVDSAGNFWGIQPCACSSLSRSSFLLRSASAAASATTRRPSSLSR